MEKKKSPNIEANFEPKAAGGASFRLSGFSGKLFEVTKFILGVSLLPFVYSASVSFLNELWLIPKPKQHYFWAGVISFLVIYLFIWEPAQIYARGHKIMEVVFSFFKPMVKVAPYLFPIYTLVFFLLYIIVSLLVKSEWPLNYALLSFGFTICLHMVFSAKAIRSRKEDFLKGNYIFGFSFVYIINITLLSVFLSLALKEFSLVDFCANSLSTANGIFYAVFKQLFLRA